MTGGSTPATSEGGVTKAAQAPSSDGPAGVAGTGGRSLSLRVVNNFLHDMATGTWAACLLVLWLLHRAEAGEDDPVVEALAGAEHAVFWLLLLALAVLVATGIVRLTYWRRTSAPDEVATKRRLLIGKHVAFLLVYGLGTAWAAVLAFA